jgi:hypothetical protein
LNFIINATVPTLAYNEYPVVCKRRSGWLTSAYGNQTEDAAAEKRQEMAIDVILTGITLIVAVIGTVLEKPPLKVKIFLIALAVAASLGSIIKAFNDESDKRFLKTALTSTLVPPSSYYPKLARDVVVVARTRGFGQYQYYHTADGTSFFLSSTDQSKHATLVFNKDEVAKMYANQIAREDNGRSVNEAFEQASAPAEMGDEFLDKVCVLGFEVFFDMFRHYPVDYTYDDSGIRIFFVDGGNAKILEFSKDELSKIEAAKAASVFYNLEQAFREKYKAAVTQKPQ